MKILPILHYPDARLRTIARPVTKFDADLVDLIDHLSVTMYKENGIGLAATQVNRHIRVIVVDISAHRNELKIFVNPQIIMRSKEQSSTKEGCLSVPHQLIRVSRAENIQVRAYDQHGNFFECYADGLLSTCIQHEIDHLDGKLIFDHLSLIKKQLYRESIARIKRKDIN